MSDLAARPLPPLLAANPRLDQWVGFPEPGRVRVATGRVEIGQGVLTAMRQIAAEELDVSPERILLQTGDTDLTPERRLHRRQPVDPIRRRRAAPRLRRGARPVSRPRRCGVRLCARRPGGARRRDIPPRRSDRPGLLVARLGGRSHAPCQRPDADQASQRALGRRPQRAAGRSRRQGVRRTGLCSRHGDGRHGPRPRGAPAAPRRDDQAASTRRRSAAPPKRTDRGRRSRSCATAISWRSWAPTKRWSRRSPPSRPAMFSGTASIRSTRSRKRRAGCCSSPRSTASSAPRRPTRRPRRPGARRPSRGCTSRMPRSRRPARWRCYRDGRLAGVVAHPGGLSAEGRARPHAEARSRGDLGAPRSGAGLLRP